MLHFNTNIINANQRLTITWASAWSVTYNDIGITHYTLGVSGQII